MVYAEFDNKDSDSVLYFYLNDSDNNAFVLYSSGSLFTSCNQLPCVFAQMGLDVLKMRCAQVFASPFCAATKDYPYVLKDHKGALSVSIEFSDAEWM
jgi:hypothetical protein